MFSQNIPDTYTHVSSLERSSHGRTLYKHITFHYCIILYFTSALYHIPKLCSLRIAFFSDSPNTVKCGAAWDIKLILTSYTAIQPIYHFLFINILCKSFLMHQTNAFVEKRFHGYEKRARKLKAIIIKGVSIYIFEITSTRTFKWST